MDDPGLRHRARHRHAARLIFFPAIMITMADPTDGRFGTLLVAALAVAFVVHASVTELWIRATRRSSAPKAGKVKAL